MSLLKEIRRAQFNIAKFTSLHGGAISPSSDGETRWGAVSNDATSPEFLGLSRPKFFGEGLIACSRLGKADLV